MTDTSPFADLKPGDYVEVRRKPWRGTVHHVADGILFAVDEQSVEQWPGTTRWSAADVESVTVLRSRPDLPTEPGTEFIGRCVTGPERVWVVLDQKLGPGLIYVPVLGDVAPVPAGEAAAAGLHVTGDIRPSMTVLWEQN